MAATRVLATRLASSMATKAARPAMRVQVGNVSKRTLTGKVPNPSRAYRRTARRPQNVIDPIFQKSIET